MARTRAGKQYTLHAARWHRNTQNYSSQISLYSFFDYPQTQESSCLCLLTATIKGVCYHLAQNCKTVLLNTPDLLKISMKAYTQGRVSNVHVWG